MVIHAARHAEIIWRRMWILGKQDKYQDNGQTNSDQHIGRYSSKSNQFVLLPVYMLNRLFYARKIDLIKSNEEKRSEWTSATKMDDLFTDIFIFIHYMLYN